MASFYYYGIYCGGGVFPHRFHLSQLSTWNSWSKQKTKTHVIIKIEMSRSTQFFDTNKHVFTDKIFNYFKLIKIQIKLKPLTFLEWRLVATFMLIKKHENQWIFQNSLFFKGHVSKKIYNYMIVNILDFIREKRSQETFS